MTTPIIVKIGMLPPTVNHMYITLRRGGKALSPDTEAFRKLVWAELAQARPVLPDGPLALTMRLTFGDRRRHDIDNRIKAGLDALAAALHFDDTRVWRIEVERVGYVAGKPLCELVLDAALRGERE